MKKTLLSHRIPNIGRNLIQFSGKELIDRVGREIIKEVVISILNGGNVRTLTEGLTQRRILISNASMFLTYLRGIDAFFDFENNFNSIITDEFLNNKLNSEDKIFLQWMIGITGKGFQNVLRNNRGQIEDYLTRFDKTLAESSLNIADEFGDITTTISLNKNDYLLKWPSLLRIFYVIGTQTLAIRGSEKSIYGKLFEKLTLGSLLSILDFKFVSPDSEQTKMVFWLSQRRSKRESDATILVKPGIGARFDLGFIGPGNTEISLDKVSRFEREMEYGKQLHYMSTIILVDRIGAGSRIVELAEMIGGTIIQMSMTHWVRDVARVLHEKLQYKHKILDMAPDQGLVYIKKRMSTIDLKSFIH